MKNEVLQKLLDGNSRFVAGAPDRPRQNIKRRAEIAEQQTPEAVMVACSDSRVPPEIIFDQGLGDLFVVRTADAVADHVALGSVEYAAEYLNVPLIVVLGHKRCGAVKAAVAGSHLLGHLPGLVDIIKAAVAAAKTQAGDLLDNAVRANVKNTVAQLKSLEPTLTRLVRENKLAIVGAYYDLDSGAVCLVE